MVEIVDRESSKQQIEPSYRITLYAVILVIAALALWLVTPESIGILRDWNTPHQPSWFDNGKPVVPGVVSYDIDTWLIHNGLLAAPRFQDTFRWWVGTWAGQVPFYRPLSSMVFWAEWKLFGDHELRYSLIAILLFLAATYQFSRLAADLFRHSGHPSPLFATGLSCLVFLFGLWLIPQQIAVNHDVFALWKNQPDSLCAFFCFLFFRSYIRLLPQQPSTKLGTTTIPDQQFPWGPCAYYLAACSSKEAGILLPLALIILEWPYLSAPNARIRQQSRGRLVPLLCAMPLFVAFRAICLHTLVGFRYGSTRSLPYRFRLEIFSTLSEYVTVRNWAPLSLGMALFGIVPLLQWRGKRYNGLGRLPLWEWFAWISATLLLLSGLALNGIGDSGYSAHNPTDLLIALLTYATPETLIASVAVAFYLGAVYNLIRKQTQLAIFHYLFALLVFLPTLASPAVLHRFYLMNAGYAMLLGAGITWYTTPRHKAHGSACPDSLSV